MNLLFPGNREMLQNLIYQINEKDIIVDAGKEWDEFAISNLAGNKVLKDQLIGKSIWSFFANGEVKSIYAHVFEKVRQTSKPVSVQYRCDSPKLKRFMELKVSLIDHGHLRIKTTLLKSEERPYQRILDSTVDRSELHVNVCSICRRFSAEEGTWDEVEVIVNRHSVFLESKPPILNERVCDACTSIVPDLDRIVSYSGNIKEDPEKPRPLLVFLHGENQRDKIFRLSAPPRLVASGKILDVEPFILLSPLKKVIGRWDKNTIRDMIEITIEQENIDRSRIYITGVSSGGASVWALLNRYPHMFAGAISISAYPSIVDPHALSQTPIWAVVGGSDEMVNAEIFARSLNKLANIHPNLRTSIISNKGHDVWNTVYNDTDLWKWLFSHSKDQADINA